MTTSRRHFVLGAALGHAAIAGSARAQSGSDAHPPSPLSARDFGARGDGRTDDHAALTAAAAAATASGRELVLPAGVYVHSRPLDLSLAGLRLRGEGQVTLRHTGAASPCVLVDAGERGVAYDHILENLIIEGSGAPDQDGLFVRNMPHSVRRNIRVRNVTGYAFHILGDVLSTWENCIVSPNEGAFRHLPARGFQIGGSPAVSSSTAVVFINCLAEGATDYGWYLDHCGASKWVGGTSEGHGRHGTARGHSIGLFISRNAAANSFDTFFMEMNRGGDLVLEGSGNRFDNCAMQSRADTSPYEAVRSIIVRSEARGNRIDGGSAYSAMIEQGALNTTIRHMELGLRIDDAGTGTVIADCLQLFNSATRFPSRTFGNVEDHNPLALDWYQELAFEPALQGARSAGRLAYRRRAGAGTRVGNMFFFSIEMEIGAVQQAPAGPLVIAGLPFAANAETGASVAIGELSNLAAEGQVGALVDPGQRAIRLVSSGGGRVPAGVEAAGLRPGAVLRLSGQYRV